MITYLDSAEGISPNQLYGFFVGWPSSPDAETHLRLLQQSGAVVLAIEEATGQVIGFITAITDGVLSAYIPLLEVLPDWQGQGIGQELVRRMLNHLRDLYMIDLLCDEDVQPFYERLGFMRSQGMIIRNYANQSGHPG